MGRVKGLRKKLRQYAVGYSFLLPTLLIFSIWFYAPLIVLFILSFSRWDIISEIKFVGLKNYDRLINEPTFWKSLEVTVCYLVPFLIVSVILGLILALMLERVRSSKLRTFYMVALFLPVVMPEIAAATVWRVIYAGEPYGLLNYFLSLLGFGWKRWLGTPELALPCIIVYSIWKNVGFNTLIFFAGLKTVPRDYYDAAQIDGAGTLQIIRYVTLPVLTPILIFVVASTTINAWQVFGPMYVMTKGGPGDATRVLVLYIYESAFLMRRMGYGATVATILLVIILVTVLVQLKLRGREK